MLRAECNLIKMGLRPPPDDPGCLIFIGVVRCLQELSSARVAPKGALELGHPIPRTSAAAKTERNQDHTSRVDADPCFVLFVGARAAAPYDASLHRPALQRTHVR